MPIRRLGAPYCTTAQRLALTPNNKDLVYDTDLKQLFIGDGTTVGGIAVGGGTLDRAIIVPSYERHIQIDAKPDGAVINQPAEVDFFTASGLQFNQTIAKYAFCQWEVPDDWDGTECNNRSRLVP